MNKKIVKETIIILLLLLVIIFAMGILFYDSITVSADVISNTDYETSQEVNAVLEEIKASSGENNIDETTSSSLLKSYSINADDLSNFANGKYYESGKKDPFAENAETIDEHTTTTLVSGTPTKTQTSNPVVKDEKNTDSNKTNTVKKETVNTNVKVDEKSTTKNVVTSNKVNSTVKEKTESTSNKGTFFENKYSK